MFKLFLELPYNDYFEYYGPDFKLHITPSNMSNHNSTDYLERVKNTLFMNLAQIEFAPSVQMHETAPIIRLDHSAALDKANPDVRLPDAVVDTMVEHESELYDGEKEGGDVRNEQSFKRTALPVSPSLETLAKKSKPEEGEIQEDTEPEPVETIPAATE